MAPKTRVGVGYNIRTAVDTKHKLIAEQKVRGDVTDVGLLTETAADKETLDIERIDYVADKDYFQAEDIEACEKASAIPHVPKPDRGLARRDGLFPKEAFAFDAEKDVYRCPGERELKFTGRGKIRRTGRRIYIGRSGVCAGCALKARCTKGEARTILRYDNQTVLERMAARIEARPKLRDLRRETVEHPFGSIKQWMNQGALLMLGLENVRAEFSLTALAYNLRRAITSLGVPALIEAVRA